MLTLPQTMDSQDSSSKDPVKSLGLDIGNLIFTRDARSSYDAFHLILDHP